MQTKKISPSNPLKNFKKLKVSTQTVMAYLNCTFNIENIEKYIECVPNTLGLTEKDLKTMKGSNGEIYQVKGPRETKGVIPTKGHFRNQIAIKIFIINKIVTIKIFRTGKFHMTGCKDINYQRAAAVSLINKIRACNTVEHPTFVIEDQDPLNIILETVMINIDFQIDFPIDQIALDKLIQKQGGEDFYTVFETTVNTSVNIKMDYEDPKVKTYEQIIFRNKKVEYKQIADCPKSKKKENRQHTFLVFNSSKVIQSGRFYETEMEPAFNKFNKFINDNKDLIELKVNHHKFDIKQLNI